MVTISSVAHPMFTTVIVIHTVDTQDSHLHLLMVHMVPSIVHWFHIDSPCSETRLLFFSNIFNKNKFTQTKEIIYWKNSLNEEKKNVKNARVLHFILTSVSILLCTFVHCHIHSCTARRTDQ